MVGRDVGAQDGGGNTVRSREVYLVGRMVGVSVGKVVGENVGEDEGE